MMTTEQAAKRLGLFRPTVTDLAAKGVLKATKFGVAWVIEEGSVQEFARLHGIDINNERKAG